MRVCLSLLVFLTVPAFGQSALPPCDQEAMMRGFNCYTTSTSPNGDKYVGEIKGGRRHGQGTLTSANGDKYVGEWRDSYRDGQGTLTYANGDKYVGEFKDSKRNGQGIYTFADGRLPLEGVWVWGDFARAQRIPDHIAGRASTPSLAQGPRQPKQAGVGQTFNSASTDEDWFPIVGSGGTREVDKASIRSLDSLTHIYRFRIDTDLSVAWWGRVNCQAGTRGEDRTAVPEGLYSVYSSVAKAEFEAVCSVAEAQHGAERLAETNSKQSGAKASRPAVPSRSSLSLAVSPSRANVDGVVTLTISTGSDTASLRVNGDEVGARADGRYTVKRFAQVGDNKYEVIATDRFGNTQRQTVFVNRAFEQTAERIEALNPLFIPAVKPRDAVAIIIGIEKYRSAPTADFANRDANIFVDYATRALGIPTQNIRLLVDDKAGAAEVLLTFKNWLPTRVSKGKTDVYVFYSGHGLPSEDGSSLYFLPHEANRELLDRTAITQKELVDALQRASPKTVTMFIDSCYSGQTRTGETLLASARPIAVAAKQATTFPPNFTVLSASAPDQISSSSPDLKHGIFSYYLMRGMEGEADSNKDKQITVAEMQAYLAENVTKRALGMNRTQQPQVVGDQSRVLLSVSGK